MEMGHGVNEALGSREHIPTAGVGSRCDEERRLRVLIHGYWWLRTHGHHGTTWWLFFMTGSAGEWPEFGRHHEAELKVLTFSWNGIWMMVNILMDDMLTDGWAVGRDGAGEPEVLGRWSVTSHQRLLVGYRGMVDGNEEW